MNPADNTGDSGTRSESVRGESLHGDFQRDTAVSGVFPACRAAVPEDLWLKIEEAFSREASPETFPDTLESLRSRLDFPPYLPDLARLEWAVWTAVHAPAESFEPDRPVVGGSVSLLDLSWKNLSQLLSPDGDSPQPIQGKDYIVVWKDPATSRVRAEAPDDALLLALKIAAEGIDPKEAAGAGNVSVSVINGVLQDAADRGILRIPPSKIIRPEGFLPMPGDEPFLSARIFTLQWHLTQACDLECAHCYDRSERATLDLGTSLRILDDLEAFCRARSVSGQVSFSGGNPFLYPHFPEVYRAAADLGFALGILGNPVGQSHLEEILSIDEPAFYQVSIEGLEETNDLIRGKGHFRRTMEFLSLLRKLGIYSIVMLTLTRENMGQVIPLARSLEGRADLFTFNRLSTVGRGADLLLPEQSAYVEFLEQYLDESMVNPIIGLKDNLLNLSLENRGLNPFGGCTGSGCGAAFNFLSLLPDGEVHACRKFPSPLGSILSRPIGEIYESELAERYRLGPAECIDCRLRAACRGCLASTFSHGLDVFVKRDPFCVRNDRPGSTGACCNSYGVSP